MVVKKKDNDEKDETAKIVRGVGDNSDVEISGKKL